AKVEGYFVAESSADLIDLVPRIIEDEFIYYRDPSGAIVGILTASDLAGAFQLNAGPYIRVGEIEARIRQILDKLPLPTLRKFLKDQDVADFNGASDMTFGEHVKTLGDEKVWTSLDLPFDQGACVNTLEKVRVVRDAIMHDGERADAASERPTTHPSNWLRLVAGEESAGSSARPVGRWDRARAERRGSWGSRTRLCGICPGTPVGDGVSVSTQFI